MRLHFPALTTQGAVTRFALTSGVFGGFVAFGLSGSTAWADSCTTPTTGPTSSDAPAFTYQCSGTYAGEWTSTYYVYDPTTGIETPLYNISYSYDCTKNAWTQNEWDYSSASSSYVENWVPATITPDQPTNCPTVGDTDASSTDSSDTANGSDTAVDNTATSNAQSGDATVADNDTAGNATSGDATTETTDTNLADTSASTLGSGVVTFTTSVDDKDGDLILDPSVILPAGTSPGTSQPTVALSSTTTDASLANTITATAASGDAVVAGNGDAGDATSGNADAIVNLINMINSAVAAGQSFIGTINVYGDLNGNILIPQSLADQLLATNATSGNDPNLSNNSDESIVNNVNTSAQSGDATVVDNSGTYGTATTGTANTNLTIMNLTGSSVVGKNVLLVFVNVLGKWVGMIVNAPAGATSAEFGGGITSSSAPSTNTGVVEAATNLNITNNVNASATSGDARVVGNQNGASATSGNADTAVNILNVENSELSLANWFGILFINVFGVWNGNFGILPPTPTAASSTANPTLEGDEGQVQTATRQFATFVPQSNNTSPAVDGAENGTVLGDAIAAPVAKRLQGATLTATDNGTHAGYLLPALGSCAALALLVAAERDRFLPGSKKK